ATAMGGVVNIRETGRVLNMDLEGATCAIQGFGNVGSFAHKLATEVLGLKVIAVSDEFGGIFNGDGLAYETVAKHVKETGRVPETPGSEPIENDDLLTLDVDVLIPAAIENQLTAQNAADVRARIIAEFANGPTTPEAD